MADPSLELQGAIVTRLKASGGVTGIVAQRIYDPVPQAPVFPYISLGPDDLVSDDAECITGFEITVQIDAWSREPGFKQVKQMSDAVRVRIHAHLQRVSPVRAPRHPKLPRPRRANEPLRDHLRRIRRTALIPTNPNPPIPLQNAAGFLRCHKGELQ